MLEGFEKIFAEIGAYSNDTFNGIVAVLNALLPVLIIVLPILIIVLFIIKISKDSPLSTYLGSQAVQSVEWLKQKVKRFARRVPAWLVILLALLVVGGVLVYLSLPKPCQKADSDKNYSISDINLVSENPCQITLNVHNKTSECLIFDNQRFILDSQYRIEQVVISDETKSLPFKVKSGKSYLSLKFPKEASLYCSTNNLSIN